MRSGKLKDTAATIGLIFDDVSNPFFARLAAAVVKITGYSYLLMIGATARFMCVPQGPRTRSTLSFRISRSTSLWVIGTADTGVPRVTYSRPMHEEPSSTTPTKMNPMILRARTES